jgi:hypothetical protein
MCRRIAGRTDDVFLDFTDLVKHVICLAALGALIIIDWHCEPSITVWAFRLYDARILRKGSLSSAENHLQSDEDNHDTEDLFQRGRRNCHSNPRSSQAAEEETCGEQCCDRDINKSMPVINPCP